MTRGPNRKVCRPHYLLMNEYVPSRASIKPPTRNFEYGERILILIPLAIRFVIGRHQRDLTARGPQRNHFFIEPTNNVDTDEPKTWSERARNAAAPMDVQAGPTGFNTGILLTV